MKIEIFDPLRLYLVKWQMVKVVFQYDDDERSQFLMEFYNVGNNFVSVQELEILFQNINEGINCKIFLLWLYP